MSDRSQSLEQIARHIRIQIVKMIATAKSGHPGGSLSAVEIITYLYFTAMNIDPRNPNKVDRDRFILSKGHAAPVLYAALARRGFFPETDLLRLRRLGCHLQGHPHRLDTPGIDASTGSLGQGLSMACGMAIGLRISGITASVFTLIGDGESQEGQIWEAAMTAGFRKLNNLCVFLDFNNLQIDGRVSDIKDIKPVRQKWQAFNWRVAEIDGHSFTEIGRAIAAFKREKTRPTLVIAHTVKGKGISFMENVPGYHRANISPEQTRQALAEIAAQREKLL